MVSAYRRVRRRLAGPPEGSLAAWVAADPARASVGADTRLGAVKMLGRARDLVDLRIGDQCDLEGMWFVHEPGARIHIGSRSELNGGGGGGTVPSPAVAPPGLAPPPGDP